MASLWRRHTNEIAVPRSPGLRLLPAMLVGVAIAAGLTYFALGVHPSGELAIPEVVIHALGTSLQLPDGTTCSLEHRGCAAVLSRLPRATIRVRAAPDTLFAAAAAALIPAAQNGVDAWLDDGSGPVSLEPHFPSQMKEWADLNPDAPGMRLRVILRADGIWIGTVHGKVLGSDPRGPSLLPTTSGQDYAGMERKLAEVKSTFPDTEEACGLLPSLDTPVGQVVDAARAIHRHFKRVLIAVQ